MYPFPWTQSLMSQSAPGFFKTSPELIPNQVLPNPSHSSADKKLGPIAGQQKGRNLWLAISLKNGKEREAACSTFPMYFVLETYFQGLRFSLGSSNRRQIVQLKPLSLLAALISLVEPKLFMFHLILCKGGWRWKKYQVLCHLLLPFLILY